MFRFLLPLIAAIRLPQHTDGWQYGRAIAQAYKGCQADLAVQQFPTRLASTTAANAEAQVGSVKN